MEGAGGRGGVPPASPLPLFYPPYFPKLHVETCIKLLWENFSSPRKLYAPNRAPPPLLSRLSYNFSPIFTAVYFLPKGARKG